MNTNYDILKKAIENNTANFIVQKHTPKMLKEYEYEHAQFENFNENEYPVAFDSSLNYFNHENNFDNILQYYKHCLNSILIVFDTTDWNASTTDFPIIIMGAMPVNQYMTIDKLEVPQSINNQLIELDQNHDLINKKIFSIMTSSQFLMNQKQLRYSAIPYNKTDYKEQNMTQLDIINNISDSMEHSNISYVIALILNEFYYDMFHSPIRVNRISDGFQITYQITDAIIDKFNTLTNHLIDIMPSDKQDTAQSRKDVDIKRLISLKKHVNKTEYSFNISKYAQLTSSHNLKNTSYRYNYSPITSSFADHMSTIIYEDKTKIEKETSINNHTYDYFIVEYIQKYFKEFLYNIHAGLDTPYWLQHNNQQQNFIVSNQQLDKTIEQQIDKILAQNPQIIELIIRTRQEFAKTQKDLLNHKPTTQIEITDIPRTTLKSDNLKKLTELHNDKHGINDLLSSLSTLTSVPRYYLDAKESQLSQISLGNMSNQNNLDIKILKF